MRSIVMSAVCLLAVGNVSAQSAPSNGASNQFNPDISLILDGRYTDIDSGDLVLPGFQLGGEAGLPENGFSLGHNELIISANVDDKFYAVMSTALIYQNGETDVELEEAYIETLGNYSGFTFKAGQFFSGMGYLNGQHEHAQDFSDRAWVYDALMGGHLTQRGLQLAWLAPTDIYLQLGAEVSAGDQYPSGTNEKNNTGRALFAKLGSDINMSSSWQLGASYFRAEFDERKAGGHHHGGHDEHEPVNRLLDGDVDISGLDFVYKWAPNGNNKSSSFTFQSEYFVRNESGFSEFEEHDVGEASSDYDGKQKGFYAQAVYKFKPQWRVGLRYDALKANNKLENIYLSGIDLDEYIEESSLGSVDDTFKRSSIMLDWSPSHFSRVRLQYNKMDVAGENKNMLSLHYTVSLGSHGAHAY